MKTKKPLICCFLLLGLALQAKLPGQGIHRIHLSFMNEATAFPFTTLGPLHPGLEAGLTLKETPKPRSLRQWNVYGGWFYHEHLSYNFYLRGEYAHAWLMGKHLSLDFNGGLGYMHHFYPGELYEIDGEEGNIKAVRQWGKPRAIANLGVGFTYRNPSRLEPFLRQEVMLESPFANGMPVMLHSMLKLGIQYKLGNHEK